MNCPGKLVLSILSFAALAGCAMNQPIRYNIGDIAPSSVTQLKEMTLSVESFSDNRRDVNDNGVVFVEGRETTIGGKRVCVNSEEHYNKEPVSMQITMAISKHLKQRAAFKDVLVDSKSSADFQLQGAIRQFYSQQDFSYTAAVGAQFGLVGALLTMNSTTPGIIKIEFTDLRLVDNNGNQVKVLENVTKIFEGELPAGAYCWHAFWNANKKLREVVDALAESVEKNLAEIVSRKTDIPKEVSRKQ